LNNLKTYSGTGIGLALCKKIVDHHDGIISAKSEIGQGATITLPVNH
jgi:signal transduction histidine kinase